MSIDRRSNPTRADALLVGTGLVAGGAAAAVAPAEYTWPVLALALLVVALDRSRRGGRG